MEITRDDIKATIQKMHFAGKQLPQKDRIRWAKDPAAEQMAVITQTVSLWWDLFKDRHIGVERWQKAVDKALMVSGVARLDTATINPALMSYALELVEKEHLEEIQYQNEQAKKDKGGFTPANFPEGFRLLAWHMAHHKRPHLPWPSDEEIFNRLAKSGRRYPEEYIRKSMTQLKFWFLFCDYAERDGEANPLKMSLSSNGYIRFTFAA